MSSILHFTPYPGLFVKKCLHNHSQRISASKNFNSNSSVCRNFATLRKNDSFIKSNKRISLHSPFIPDLSLWKKNIINNSFRKDKNYVKKNTLIVKGFFGIVEAIVATTLLIGGLVSVSVSIGLATIATAFGIFLFPFLGLLLFTLTPLKLSLGLFGAGLFFIFDKIASTFLILNFGAAILSIVFKSLKKDGSKRYISSNEIQLSNPILATVFTFVPGLEWLPWVWALFDSEKNLTFGKKVLLLKNSLFYGGISLFSIVLTGKIFSIPGNAWSLSQLLGAIHFVLMQRGYLDDFKEVESGVVEDMDKLLREAERKKEDEKKAKALSLEAEEILRRRKELAEFDLKLRPNENRLNNPRLVIKWEVGDVVDWLRSENLSQHAVAIVQHDVDGKVLTQLSESDLKDELGIVTLGERKRFMDAVSRLKNKAGL